LRFTRTSSLADNAPACVTFLQCTEAVATRSRLLGVHGTTAPANASTGMWPHSAAGGVCSTDSRPEQWTNVTHNDLFVPLPLEPAVGACTDPPEQQQQQQQQLTVVPPASPRAWAGRGSTALVLLPGNAGTAASPTAQHTSAIDLQQVQDAVLQQVLGIGLQELLSGGLMVSLLFALLGRPNAVQCCCQHLPC
jgi:hypothetical protein